VNLTTEDLLPFAAIEETKAQAMIDDALALAARVAPCILTDAFEYGAAAKAILRGAILRWNDSGSGALQAQAAGPFSQTLDTRQQRRGMFWPSEIEALQNLCKGDETSGAFSIDTAPAGGMAAGHADSCALNFGALYCSCGYVLTQSLPLYGA
jgi:hypothetical protein